MRDEPLVLVILGFLIRYVLLFVRKVCVLSYLVSIQWYLTATWFVVGHRAVDVNASIRNWMQLWKYSVLAFLRVILVVLLPVVLWKTHQYLFMYTDGWTLWVAVCVYFALVVMGGQLFWRSHDNAAAPSSSSLRHPDVGQYAIKIVDAFYDGKSGCMLLLHLCLLCRVHAIVRQINMGMNGERCESLAIWRRKNSSTYQEQNKRWIALILSREVPLSIFGNFVIAQELWLRVCCWHRSRVLRARRRSCSCGHCYAEENMGNTLQEFAGGLFDYVCFVVVAPVLLGTGFSVPVLYREMYSAQALATNCPNWLVFFVTLQHCVCMLPYIGEACILFSTVYRFPTRAYSSGVMQPGKIHANFVVWVKDILASWCAASILFPTGFELYRLAMDMKKMHRTQSRTYVHSIVFTRTWIFFTQHLNTVLIAAFGVLVGPHRAHEIFSQLSSGTKKLHRSRGSQVKQSMKPLLRDIPLVLGTVFVLLCSPAQLRHFLRNAGHRAFRKHWYATWASSVVVVGSILLLAAHSMAMLVVLVWSPLFRFRSIAGAVSARQRGKGVKHMLYRQLALSAADVPCVLLAAVWLCGLHPHLLRSVVRGIRSRGVSQTWHRSVFSASHRALLALPHVLLASVVSVFSVRNARLWQELPSTSKNKSSRVQYHATGMVTDPVVGAMATVLACVSPVRLQRCVAPRTTEERFNRLTMRIALHFLQLMLLDVPTISAWVMLWIPVSFRLPQLRRGSESYNKSQHVKVWRMMEATVVLDLPGLVCMTILYLNVFRVPLLHDSLYQRDRSYQHRICDRQWQVVAMKHAAHLVTADLVHSFLFWVLALTAPWRAVAFFMLERKLAHSDTERRSLLANQCYVAVWDLALLIIFLVQYVPASTIASAVVERLMPLPSPRVWLLPLGAPDAKLRASTGHHGYLMKRMFVVFLEVFVLFPLYVVAVATLWRKKMIDKVLGQFDESDVPSARERIKMIVIQAAFTVIADPLLLLCTLFFQCKCSWSITKRAIAVRQKLLALQDTCREEDVDIHAFNAAYGSVLYQIVLFAAEMMFVVVSPVLLWRCPHFVQEIKTIEETRLMFTAFAKYVYIMVLDVGAVVVLLPIAGCCEPWRADRTVYKGVVEPAHLYWNSSVEYQTRLMHKRLASLCLLYISSIDMLALKWLLVTVTVCALPYRWKVTLRQLRLADSLFGANFIRDEVWFRGIFCTELLFWGRLTGLMVTLYRLPVVVRCIANCARRPFETSGNIQRVVKREFAALITRDSVVFYKLQVIWNVYFVLPWFVQRSVRFAYSCSSSLQNAARKELLMMLKKWSLINMEGQVGWPQRVALRVGLFCLRCQVDGMGGLPFLSRESVRKVMWYRLPHSIWKHQIIGGGLLTVSDVGALCCVSRAFRSEIDNTPLYWQKLHQVQIVEPLERIWRACNDSKMEVKQQAAIPAVERLGVPIQRLPGVPPPRQNMLRWWQVGAAPPANRRAAEALFRVQLVRDGVTIASKRDFQRMVFIAADGVKQRAFIPQSREALDRVRERIVRRRLQLRPSSAAWQALQADMIQMIDFESGFNASVVQQCFDYAVTPPVVFNYFATMFIFSVTLCMLPLLVLYMLPRWFFSQWRLQPMRRLGYESRDLARQFAQPSLLTKRLADLCVRCWKALHDDCLWLARMLQTCVVGIPLFAVPHLLRQAGAGINVCNAAVGLVLPFYCAFELYLLYQLWVLASFLGEFRVISDGWVAYVALLEAQTAVYDALLNMLWLLSPAWSMGLPYIAAFSIMLHQFVYEWNLYAAAVILTWAMWLINGIVMVLFWRLGFAYAFYKTNRDIWRRLMNLYAGMRPLWLYRYLYFVVLRALKQLARFIYDLLCYHYGRVLFAMTVFLKPWGFLGELLLIAVTFAWVLMPITVTYVARLFHVFPASAQAVHVFLLPVVYSVVLLVWSRELISAAWKEQPKPSFSSASANLSNVYAAVTSHSDAPLMSPLRRKHSTMRQLRRQRSQDKQKRD